MRPLQITAAFANRIHGSCFCFSDDTNSLMVPKFGVAWKIIDRIYYLQKGAWNQPCHWVKIVRFQWYHSFPDPGTETIFFRDFVSTKSSNFWRPGPFFKFLIRSVSNRLIFKGLRSDCSDSSAFSDSSLLSVISHAADPALFKTCLSLSENSLLWSLRRLGRYTLPFIKKAFSDTFFHEMSDRAWLWRRTCGIDSYICGSLWMLVVLQVRFSFLLLHDVKSRKLSLDLQHP